MMSQDSDEYKSIPSRPQTPDLHRHIRASFPTEEHLLSTYTLNLLRKEKLVSLIAKLKPNLVEKKLAAELKSDHRAMGVQEIIDSDKEQDFDDINLDLKSIKKDYVEKMAILDDLEKNKYGALQKAYIRRFCEVQLSENPTLRDSVKSSFRIKQYFVLGRQNKFGVLTTLDPLAHLIKFVSVGIPDKILESIRFDFPIDSVEASDTNLLLVTQSVVQLYCLNERRVVFKTHHHGARVVYAAFPYPDSSKLVTVTESGVVRLFDLTARNLFWMCMTDPLASVFYCEGNLLHYSVGNQLLSVSLVTKEVKIVGSCAEPILEIKQRHVLAGRKCFNRTGMQYQLSQSSDFVDLESDAKYSCHPDECSVSLNNQASKIQMKNSVLIGVFKIKIREEMQNVALFGGLDGELSQVTISKARQTANTS